MMLEQVKQTVTLKDLQRLDAQELWAEVDDGEIRAVVPCGGQAARSVTGGSDTIAFGRQQGGQQLAGDRAIIDD